MPERAKVWIAPHSNCQPMGFITTPDGRPHPVILDSRRLPLSDNSLDPEQAPNLSGLVPFDELKRVTGQRTISAPSKLDGVPILGKVRMRSRQFWAGYTAIKAGEETSTRYVQQNAVDLYQRGQFDSLAEWRAFVELAERSPTRLLAFDTAAPLGQFTANRILDFTMPTIAALLLKDKQLAAEIGVLCVGIANGLSIKTGYLLTRLYREELPHVRAEYKKGNLTKEQVMKYGATYAGIAFVNLFHLISYPAQPIIGVAQNRDLAIGTSRLLFRPITRRIKRLSQGQQSEPQVGNIDEVKEWLFCAEVADKVTVFSDPNIVPVLTADEVGDRRYTRGTRLLPRVHRGTAPSISHALNGSANAFVDVMNFARQANAKQFSRRKLSERDKHRQDKFVRSVVDYFGEVISKRPDSMPVVTTNHLVGNALIEKFRGHGDCRAVVMCITDPYFIDDHYFKFKDVLNVYYCVIDVVARNKLIAKGINPLNIYVTGALRDDVVFGEKLRHAVSEIANLQIKFNSSQI